MTNVFVYGSLMSPQVWEGVVGGADVAALNLPMLDAVLNNYARYKVEGKAYPAMIPEEGNQVAGKLIIDVSEAQLDRLNRFEDVNPLVPNLGEYTLTPVSVVHDNQEVPAVAYVANDELRSRVTYEDWDPVFFELHISDFMSTVVREFRAGLESEQHNASDH